MNVNFDLSSKQRNAKEVMVVVSTAKLDASWAKDSGFYIPANGGGAEIGGRRDGFKSFLATGATVEPSTVCLDEQGEVSFVDGRHRFSVLRDMGARQVVVAIHKSQAKKLAKIYG